jgi:hypothetical protein
MYIYIYAYIFIHTKNIFIHNIYIYIIMYLTLHRVPGLLQLLVPLGMTVLRLVYSADLLRETTFVFTYRYEWIIKCLYITSSTGSKVSVNS